ncbi:kelch-like protein 24a [Branchiostoma lanceolatum]|uniref:kelch-like protein 24a n=1 Tax=Branchiostoma lanceolatum TaxID=7740 RepID=UPI003456B585
MDNSQSVDNEQTAEVSKTLDDNETVGKKMVYDYSKIYPAWFLERLQDWRSEGHLVDVTLCAEGKEIPCHRLVLSACSDYFHAMFSGAHNESKKAKIEIGGVDGEALQLLVDFAYTSKVCITTDNVQPLYEAANMLQVGRVEEGCENFLAARLDPETCLVTWALADKVSCTYLSAIARSFALKFFEYVCTTEEFLELPVNFLKTYISKDDLHAEKEERVLEVILLWVGHDLEERQGYLKELLECVRFSHVDQHYLKNIMKTDKVLGAVSGIQELIQDQTVQERCCQIFQGEILIFGGVKDKGEDMMEMNCNMYRLDLHGNLVHSTPLPEPLHDSTGTAACVVKNDVIVTGGRKSPSQAWRYRSSLNSWMKLGSLRRRRYDHGMAVLQGKVYVVGGIRDHRQQFFNQSHVEVTEVYNELTDSWDKVAPLLQAVSCFGISTCCEKIYVFGGQISYRGRTEVQCYNPTLNVWTFATPLPNLMQSINACTFNSRIYLVGGKSVNLDHVLCYDPQEDCYLQMADSIAPWELSSATVCGSEIYITGGMYEDEGCSIGSCKVQCYNVKSDTMIRVKDLPIPLWEHISVTIPKL